MNQEDAFIEEAQEEVIIHEESQNKTQKVNVRFSSLEHSSDEENENHPLIGSARPSQGRPPRHNRGYSYERAINEPWTGAYRSGVQPWYKQPSVS